MGTPPTWMLAAALQYWCNSRAHPVLWHLGGCMSSVELSGKLHQWWRMQCWEMPQPSAGWKPSLSGHSRQGFQHPSCMNCHATLWLTYYALDMVLPRGFFYGCGCSHCCSGNAHVSISLLCKSCQLLMGLSALLVFPCQRKTSENSLDVRSTALLPARLTPE